MCDVCSKENPLTNTFFSALPFSRTCVLPYIGGLCSLLIRKDLRDLFDQLAVTRKSNKKLNSEKSRSAPELCAASGARKIGKFFCLTMRKYSE